MKVRICDICGKRIKEGIPWNQHDSKPKAKVWYKGSEGKYRKMEICEKCAYRISDYCKKADVDD